MLQSLRRHQLCVTTCCWTYLVISTWNSSIVVSVRRWNRRFGILLQTVFDTDSGIAYTNRCANHSKFHCFNISLFLNTMEKKNIPPMCWFHKQKKKCPGKRPAVMNDLWCQLNSDYAGETQRLFILKLFQLWLIHNSKSQNEWRIMGELLNALRIYN